MLACIGSCVKIAVVLFNLGGPDSLQAVEPFLRNLFSDPAILSVPGLVSSLSAVCPLLPGDLIFTGTPDGVGSGRTPPVYLRPGDEVVSRIEGIGAIRQRCVAPDRVLVHGTEV